MRNIAPQVRQGQIGTLQPSSQVHAISFAEFALDPQRSDLGAWRVVVDDNVDVGRLAKASSNRMFFFKVQTVVRRRTGPA